MARLTYSLQQRLHLIDFLLEHFGCVKRKHLMDYYGISMPQASNDFAVYQRLAPKNMVYTAKAGRYERGPDFKRIFP